MHWPPILENISAESRGKNFEPERVHDRYSQATDPLSHDVPILAKLRACNEVFFKDNEWKKRIP